ncbi:puromycin-sensitive aminopeptidase [Cyclospora cayetanensis]|uniref:Puromycin-sensitive aminopeptidase n=1 Tax=Cyclospora cayetanensis TaxID=88456 RepID=A0A6P6S431_9EIME|nr:puromycin-sensitive aminopeptidase [Cyclospora cayetanensis]
MAWDEKVFGLEYDLDVFSVVCVRDFNMGAMENKGLNIFNSSLLLADRKTTTDAEYERILGVVGHEYFHNWTGNRVTCRDWFQLTLKEGLTVFRDQLFSADMCSAAVKRIEDVTFLRAHQFPEDSGPMSHPIRPETYIAMDNFYTFTVYEKGAEVIRMLHTLLGPEGFRKGMDLYFKRHDGQAVTCDDFRAAMADANGRDFSQFERWYSQSGTPEVEVLEQQYDASARRYTLRLRQHTPSTPGQKGKLPLVIPIKVGLIGKNSKKDLLTPPTQVLEFTEREQSFEFTDINEPCVPSLFRDFSAPVKVLPYRTDEDTAFLMAFDSDPVNRWDASNTLAFKLLLERSKFLSSNNLAQEGMPPLSKIYTEAFRTTLADEQCDRSIKALTLQLPSWEVLSQEMSPIYPDALQLALKTARLELYSAFKSELSALYERLTLPEDDAEEALDAANVARRRLRNVVLRLLSAPGDEEAAARAYNHFTASKCMTDRYAALLALADMPQPQREKALEEFFQEAAGNPLMLDKWFRAQAGSDLDDQVERVAELQKHSAFTSKSPNRLRSLFSAFVFNRPHFHRADGKGYKLISDVVIEVDAFNPQAAARLAGAFLQWQRFDTDRQELMKKQLRRIKEAPGLSPDTLEIVQRALKPAEEQTATA